MTATTHGHVERVIYGLETVAAAGAITRAGLCKICTTPTTSEVSCVVLLGTRYPRAPAIQQRATGHRYQRSAVGLSRGAVCAANRGSLGAGSASEDWKPVPWVLPLGLGDRQCPVQQYDDEWGRWG
ncbi:predicted protein [Histoplasma capsulatum G186AR]|uniref:Uncharacterized protein n=1 Tax=Ajellomyces capsulatus (strain G186AR / H82 / ATCC MYA-2454 / RMSCC 2432) TaxID=447093 RepID=C0NE11_AJECG|nr:uncharacterized protein HCBG_02104 [Histoplasma capsulatum G186AR]EEH10459.1 predicted protein [Histoplasma capsulatum G186AR]